MPIAECFGLNTGIIGINHRCYPRKIKKPLKVNTIKGLNFKKCPGLDSNQHILANAAT